jgi:hypothetical protein
VNEVYTPRDDETEAAQLRSAQGVGETNYLDDDQVRMYSMQDLGLMDSDTVFSHSRFPRS